MGTSGPAFPEVLAARTSPNKLFSEVIDLRLQSVELFLGRIVSGPQPQPSWSTDVQDAQLQRDALTLAGCGRDRPGLVAALDYMRAGDTLAVGKLDRAGAGHHPRADHGRADGGQGPGPRRRAAHCDGRGQTGRRPGAPFAR